MRALLHLAAESPNASPAFVEQTLAWQAAGGISFDLLDDQLREQTEMALLDACQRAARGERAAGSSSTEATGETLMDGAAAVQGWLLGR